MLGFLGRLRNRMAKLEFPPDDEVFLQANIAYHAVFALNLHFQRIAHGTVGAAGYRDFDVLAPRANVDTIDLDALTEEELRAAIGEAAEHLAALSLALEVKQRVDKCDDAL